MTKLKVDKRTLDELAKGDTLYVTLPDLVQGNALIPPDPEGFGKAHREAAIQKLAAHGITAVPMVGLGQLRWWDIGNSKGFRFRLSYGIEVVAIGKAPEQEALQAGFPIVGVLVGAAVLLLAFGLVKKADEILDVFSDAVDVARKAVETVGPGIGVALPILAIGAVWWVATQ